MPDERDRVNIIMYNIDGKPVHNITVLDDYKKVNNYIQGFLKPSVLTAKFTTEEHGILLIPRAMIDRLTFLVNKVA